MLNLNERLSIIIDPSHERFAQAGRISLDQELISQTGDLAISYSDGTEAYVNNGRTTGLAQFYIVEKDQAGEAEHLINILPSLKERLSEIFARVVEPENENLTPETQAASAAAAYLIAAELHPELYGQRTE